MSSIDELFARTRAENRAALVGYLPAGFPSKELSIKAIEAMVDGGVDLVEVGLPYSDPVMDGPTSRPQPTRRSPPGRVRPMSSTSCERAAATGAPTVVMTYWNPVERFGVNRFAAIRPRPAERAHHP